MIIEGAFYKLPELLISHASPRWQYEATLASHLAMAVLLELNARNLPMPQSRIHIERPYPIEKAGPASRADLFVDLEGVFTHGLWMPCYGAKRNTWLEAKFFGSIGRGTGTEPKTENAARILKDLLRLCIFVKEERSGHRDNSRYFVAIFNRTPEIYLAYQRRFPGESDREWLRTLLSPGRHQLQISLDGEATVFVRTVGTGFTSLADPLEVSLDVVTYSFEPTALPSEFLYWGYLVRIIKFTVCLGSDQLVYDESDDTIWSEEQVNMQQRLVERVFGLLGGGA
jgi:hypothetical protein